MKVCLIFPPKVFKKFEENPRVVSEEFGKYPPMGIAYVASIIENAGHNALIIDANALNMKKERALDIVKKYKPDLIGFALHSTYCLRENIEWIKFLKENTRTAIMVGDLVVSQYTEEVMTYKEIDYAFIGHVDKSLPRFLEIYSSGKLVRLKEVDGLCYRKKGKVIINKKSKAKVDFESFPMPARHLLPNAKYFQYISKKKNFTIMLSSLGCPFNCTFCALRQSGFITRSAKNVVDEIEECYNKYGVREIDFFDPEMTADKKRIVEICREIKRRGIKIDWSCRSRIDTVNEEVLKEMSEAGCKRIYYGIESGDQDMIKRIKKNISFDKVRETVNLSKKYRIMPLGFFMIGNPGETVETIKASMRLAEELDLDYIQYSRTVAKPKTLLDKELIKEFGKDYWRDYVLGNVEDIKLPNIWCDLTDEEIDYWTRKAYLDFYLKPRRLFKTILRIKSIDELKRYIVAGLRMIRNEF